MLTAQRAIQLLLIPLLFVSLVLGGVLWITQERSGSGTKFILNWGQGCEGGVPPAACKEANSPWYCPPDSTGNTPLVQDCTICGCGYGYYCDTQSKTCKRCGNPCSPCATNWNAPNQCSSYSCEPCCGDGSCNNGETCSTCEEDCGSCPPPPKEDDGDNNNKCDPNTCCGSSCMYKCSKDCCGSCCCAPG